MFSFTFNFFLRAALGFQQNCKGGTKMSHTLPTPHMHSLFLYQHHSLKCYICFITNEPCLTQSP